MRSKTPTTCRTCTPTTRSPTRSWRSSKADAGGRPPRPPPAVRWVVVAAHPDATPVLIRAVRPDDDLDAQLDLAERSFGPSRRTGRDQRRRAGADPGAAGRSLGA